MLTAEDLSSHNIKCKKIEKSTFSEINLQEIQNTFGFVILNYKKFLEENMNDSFSINLNFHGVQVFVDLSPVVVYFFTHFESLTQFH